MLDATAPVRHCPCNLALGHVLDVVGRLAARTLSPAKPVDGADAVADAHQRRVIEQKAARHLDDCLTDGAPHTEELTDVARLGYESDIRQSKGV